MADQPTLSAEPQADFMHSGAETNIPLGNYFISLRAPGGNVNENSDRKQQPSAPQDLLETLGAFADATMQRTLAAFTQQALLSNAAASPDGASGGQAVVAGPLDSPRAAQDSRATPAEAALGRKLLHARRCAGCYGTSREGKVANLALSIHSYAPTPGRRQDLFTLLTVSDKRYRGSRLPRKRLSLGRLSCLVFMVVAFALQLPGAAPPCAQGFVWREAFRGDYVCVPPASRSQAARENSDPASAEPCRQGTVWREAGPSDHVCVPAARRSAVADENRGGR